MEHRTCEDTVRNAERMVPHRGPIRVEVLDSLFITQGILPNRIRPQAPDGGKKNHGSDQPSLTFAVFRHARKRR